MKTLLSFLLCISPLKAQIYADIAVTKDDDDLGTIRIRLEHEKTPRTVANFIGLATGQHPWIDPLTGTVQRNQPYYDGLIFHRLIHNFVIQGGDPTGTGSSGPGYVYQDEFDPSLRHDSGYLLSMANSGTLTNGSQFFITLAAANHLDDRHSIFGEVIDDATFPNSRALVDSFTDANNFPTPQSDGDTDPNTGSSSQDATPKTAIVMKTVTISGPDLAGFDLFDPTLRIPTFEAIQNVRLQHLPENQEQATDETFLLTWDAEIARDYPIFYSHSLDSFFRAGSSFSMVEEAASETNINSLALEEKGFARLPIAINYSSLPQAPSTTSLVENGAQLEMTWSEGTLTLTFDGAGAMTWTFNHGETSGSSTSLSVSENAPYFTPIDGEKYISQNTTLARARSLRQLTTFLDGSVGASGITAIQPTLSFHDELSGYFDGPANSTLATTFRGTFTFTPAP